MMREQRGKALIRRLWIALIGTHIDFAGFAPGITEAHMSYADLMAEQR